MEILQIFTIFREAPEAAKVGFILIQSIAILAMAVWKIRDWCVKRDLRAQIEKERKDAALELERQKKQAADEVEKQRKVAAHELAMREEKWEHDLKHFIDEAQRERSKLLEMAEKERERMAQDNQKAIQQALADQQNKVKAESDHLHENISQLIEENARLKVRAGHPSGRSRASGPLEHRRREAAAYYRVLPGPTPRNSEFLIDPFGGCESSSSTCRCCGA